MGRPSQGLTKQELKEKKRQYDVDRRLSYSNEDKNARSECKKRYNQSEKGRACIKRANQKRTSTPEGVIASRIRSQIQMRLTGKVKGKFRHLTFTINELRVHLELKFKPGMTWENRRLWHIDHKIPLKFKREDGSFYWNQDELADITSDTFRKAWSLENLQPMWAADNIRKSNKAVL